MVECEYVNWSEVYKHADCFNRYMVECECICPFCSVNLIIVLIDTWWNVNDRCGDWFRHLLRVLIDTWWNVNTLQSPDAKTDSTF